MTELAEYIADNYGVCRVEPCDCLRYGWKGRMCRNWKPVEARNWEELRDLLSTGLDLSRST